MLSAQERVKPSSEGPGPAGADAVLAARAIRPIARGIDRIGVSWGGRRAASPPRVGGTGRTTGPARHGPSRRQQAWERQPDRVEPPLAAVAGGSAPGRGGRPRSPARPRLLARSD